MLSKRQIDRIVKKKYPAFAYSHKERKFLRLAMREEITEYLDEYPNATYEELQQHYGNGISTILQDFSTVHMTKIIVCIGVLLAIVCAIVYSISNGWIPPTYYF